MSGLFELWIWTVVTMDGSSGKYFDFKLFYFLFVKHALIAIFFISGSDFATAGPSKKRSFDCVSPAETQEERPPKRRPGINPQSIHPQPTPRSPSPIISPFIFPYFIPNPVGHIPIPQIATPAHLDPPRRFRPRVPAHSRAVKTLLPLFMAQAPSSQKVCIYFVLFWM